MGGGGGETVPSVAANKQENQLQYAFAEIVVVLWSPIRPTTLLIQCTKFECLKKPIHRGVVPISSATL